MRDSGGSPGDFYATSPAVSGPFAPPPNPTPHPTQPLPPGWFPPGHLPGGQFPPGQFPPGYLPAGQFPPGHMRFGQVPPAQVPWHRPRRRLPRWAAPVVVVVVLALLLSGVYAGVTKMSGGGRQPESLVPANALAFAKLDLDPGFGQKIAAYRLAKKLPGHQGQSDEDVRSNLLDKLFADTDISYDRDIKPWLGDRMAIAALPATGSGDPEPLGVLEVQDETKARAFLNARQSVGDDLGYVLRDGYVLLSDRQAVVDRASRSASDHSLQDENRFRQDLQRLHGGKIATAWVDVPAVLEAAESAHPEQVSQLSAVKDIQGRLVAGISAADDALELEARVVGARNVPSGQDVLDRLEDLPAGSPVGAAVSTSALTADPDASRALDQFLDDTADDLDSEYGLAPKDIRNLLGGNVVLGLAGAPRDDEDPKLAVLVDGIEDPSRAADTIQAFLGGDESSGSDATDGSSNPNVQVQQTGPGVVVSTDADYGRDVDQHTGGRLGDDELFRRAMADSPDHTLGAVYVAVQPLLETADDVPAEARAVQAVGVTVGTDNDEVVLHARVVIG